MTDIRFDTYYRYETLTGFLREWAEHYPNLCRLGSLGQSFEGREIWVVTLTNFETGPDQDKPAYWVDANIHATEVAPSAAALYLIHKLLNEYGRDEKLTYVLDSRAFYVVPRLNPDGAELALADRPRFLRSSTRPYPRTDELDGLHQEDMDGDGRILQMRLKDPHGAWKPHPDEPSLLIRREPDDLPGGDYYRLLPEGRIRNYDGVTIQMAPPLAGLDLNRNFPVNWLPSEQGAGPFPTSEPEVRAAVQFVTDHPNITGGLTFHTFSGVHLRPLSIAPDDSLPSQDLRTYQAIGRKGEALTGYPAASVYHEFKYDPKDYIKGTFDDWLYEHLGLYAWTTEIWSPQRQAGLEVKKYIEWFREHPVEEDLKLFHWAREILGQDGYVEWRPFEHPQLGPVELGGWNVMITWRNPPPHLLEKEIAPLADFVIFNCLISPKLEIHTLTTEKQGDIFTIRLVLHNTGWLPTNVSQKALEMKAVRELEVDISLPEGARLLSGEMKAKVGQLAGRDDKGAVAFWAGDATRERAKVEWVVQAPQGGQATITAVHQRAGTVRVVVDLEK
ncbi:MAG: M14 family metallopeptidase [Chloroflexi bacterium]|nr:M14 family metallopeptidase [Chloroflexota bacterium]MCI0574651.1 M14 family metallopeptidase [Chloroflexota bacterium]MCI0649067.1 M14 family metallopeptidase [Chloroflexota bacterium]MCI0730522.1 M14 family metallopeptidase [Chloroflexota bacterium]